MNDFGNAQKVVAGMSGRRRVLGHEPTLARSRRDSNPNVPILPAAYADWTAYLIANPFKFTNANGTVRTYNFVLGSTADGSGVGTRSVER